MLLTKTTVMQNEAALSYHIVRGLYFLGVIFAGPIVYLNVDCGWTTKNGSKFCSNLRLVPPGHVSS